MRLIFQQCHLLRELAPLLTNQPVAGFHRARPSTTLDKASIQFTQYYTPVLPKVKLKQYGSAGGVRPPSSLTRRWEASFHRIVNCGPARRCVRPVLAPAQAWVRAGAGRRGAFGARFCVRFTPGIAFLLGCFASVQPALAAITQRLRRDDSRSVSPYACRSGGVFCGRFTTGIAALSMRLTFSARFCVSIVVFCLGSRLTLRFCRGFSIGICPAM